MSVFQLCFKDLYNLLGMMDRLETCRVYRATIPLPFLQISDLHTVPTRFFEPLNEKNRMCELYMHVFLNPVITERLLAT